MNCLIAKSFTEIRCVNKPLIDLFSIKSIMFIAKAAGHTKHTYINFKGGWLPL